jgi:hypothetical protein
MGRGNGSFSAGPDISRVFLDKIERLGGAIKRVSTVEAEAVELPNADPPNSPNKSTDAEGRFTPLGARDRTRATSCSIDARPRKSAAA